VGISQVYLLTGAVFFDVRASEPWVADRVGYESEAAFSRAFKKVVGVPPSQWRQRRPRH
jgi:transcriptional regulator GlxA family with amidase domain